MTERCKECGSYAINHRSCGRDGSDPDLCDVHYWKKRSDQFKTEVARLTDELAQLRCDYQGAEGDVEHWKSLAAARLADQEAIERHVTKRVAGECAEIAETFRTPYGSHPLLSGVQIGAVIRNKYGAE